MKSIKSKLIAWIGVLSVCLLPIGTQAAGHHQSGIIGQIEQVPGPWNVRVVSESGKLVANIQADENGFFEADLKPGTYVLTPYILSIDGSGALLGVSTPVAVEKKEFTTVELPILNGPI
jgi:hypothetical protein